MIIGIDIDDTISNTIQQVMPRAEKFVKNILHKDLSVFDYSKAIDHNYIENVFELSKEEATEFWSNNLKDILENATIKEQAAEVINKLKAEGHKIILITSRWKEDNFNPEELSVKWLQENKVEYDKIYVEIDDKKQIALKENLDLFIDDSIRNCREISKVGIKCFLFSTEVNSKIEEAKKFEVVETWNEIYKKINGGK